MASRPSDSGRPNFSSMRSASWTISAISVSTGSSSSYSLRNVSKEQSSPRWESLAPATSKSSAPPGPRPDRRRRRRRRPDPRSALSARCRRCDPRGTRGEWPTASALAPGTWDLARSFAASHGLAGGLEGSGRLAPERGAEVVSAPLRPELLLDLAQLLRQALAAHLRLEPQALGLGDDGPVGLFPRRAELLHQLGFLCQRARPCLPQGRLSPCLPHPELQPLQLLAGDSVLGERDDSILDVECAEVPELAPHRHAVARGLSREPVDEQHPARPLHGSQPAPVGDTDRRGLHAGTLEVLPGFQPALQGVRLVPSLPQLLRGHRTGGPAVAEGDHPLALQQLEPLHGPLVA